jgi:cytoplasmic iron level regulating protein YaaA (DUF328/UPF0246 family)
MIILLNSSKTLNFERPAHISKYTIPEFLEDCELLVGELRKFSVSGFAGLMGVSENLATLNVRRYKNWRKSPGISDAKQALLAFKGDIYAKKARGLMCDYIIQNRITRVEDLQSFNSDGYRFAPAHSSEREWVFTRGDIRA